MIRMLSTYLLDFISRFCLVTKIFTSCVQQIRKTFIISGEKVPLREVVVIVSVLYIIWSFSNGVLKVRGQQSGGEILDRDNTYVGRLNTGNDFTKNGKLLQITLKAKNFQWKIFDFLLVELRKFEFCYPCLESEEKIMVFCMLFGLMQVKKIIIFWHSTWITFESKLVCTSKGGRKYLELKNTLKNDVLKKDAYSLK